MLYAILKALSYKLYITNNKSVTKYTPIVVHKWNWHKNYSKKANVYCQSE